MKKQHYLWGVGIVGLAIALAASPASATEDEPDSGEVASEAIGTFSGFRFEATEQAIKAARLTADFSAAPAAVSTTSIPVSPDPRLIARDDIGIDGAVDINNTLPSVVHLFMVRHQSGAAVGSCTGTLINPRTVLTAAHCVFDVSSEAYGVAGGATRVVYVSTGVDSRPRLLATANDPSVGYAEGGAARSTDVIIHPSSNLVDGDLDFPWADVALIALDQPITDVPSLPLLLSPLTQLTHVIVTGYGTNGTGDTGGTNAGNQFLRRIGENMLDMIGSNADFIDGVYPGFAPSAVDFGVETQTQYWIDFDNPDRTPEQQAGCSFTGADVICADRAAERAINWFGGDALPREAGIAPGDSGSPLIVDQLYNFPIVAGVLSGDYTFFEPRSAYATPSFYTPLHAFFEFITENTPYKYVSTKGGSARWSNPNFWTQNLDPGFFIDDGTGNLVNGIPTGSETGVYTTGPKLGNVLGDDVSDNSTAPSTFLPAPGTPNFGANLPQSSRLLGPGSTGFVPNNTDGITGTSFAKPAQYFDVILNKQGRVTVDINVTIDKLTIDNSNALLSLNSGFDFNSIIGVEQYRGTSAIHGDLTAGIVTLFGGRLLGSGSVTTTHGFFNSGGLVSAGLLEGTGTLVVGGNYIQSSRGTYLANINATSGSSDFLLVTGTAILGGTLAVQPLNRVSPTFGSQFIVLAAREIDGNFGRVVLSTDSPLLFATSSVRGNAVVVQIGAKSVSQVVGPSSGLASLGTALDTLRFSGRYSQFEHIFGIVDNAGYQTFGQTLAGLTPTSGFAQAATANGFSQRFTGQIAQRTLTLRGANQAAAGFSAAGNASFAQAGTAPDQPGKLGFFGSVSGSFLTMSGKDYNLGSTAVADAAFLQAGELTLGADYRLSDGVTVGMAVTNIRNSAQSRSGFRPNEDQSVAVAAYAAATFGKAFADLYVGVADQSYGIERGAQGDFTSAYRSALGSADGQQTFAGARVGYALSPATGLTVGPVASLDYVRSDLGGFTEFGAGSFGLTVRERSVSSIGAKLGAMASLDVYLGRTSKLTAFGSVAYARELADKRDVITATFAGAEDVPFTIANQLDPQWVAVNAGAQLSLSDRLSTKMSVTSDLGRGVLTNNQANLSLNWKF